MSYVEIPGTVVPIKAWVKGVILEERAQKQLLNLSGLPFIYKHIAAMPDTHWGMGATVGSVIATEKAVIPAAVGVDIGCGMMAQQTTLKADDLPTDLSRLRSLIERRIPHGRTDNGGANDRGAWGSQPETTSFLPELKKLLVELDALVARHPALKRGAEKCIKHAGTLGGGNHFVEICLDETDTVWIMLHSGSRGIGNTIGKYFIEKAQNEMRRWFINLPDQDLAYFPEGSVHYTDYLLAVDWAQRFAALNRCIMMEAAMAALEQYSPIAFDVQKSAINCHHNYVEMENHYGKNVLVTRKGAVRARQNDLGIIPGSMGAKSFIVRGKGNPESFCSCSHGAGRAMSRQEARNTFTVEDHIRATVGVECKKDDTVIDETPAAYKDIDAVMKAQADLVEIVHTLKQIVCVKG